MKSENSPRENEYTRDELFNQILELKKELNPTIENRVLIQKLQQRLDTI